MQALWSANTPLDYVSGEGTLNTTRLSALSSAGPEASRKRQLSSPPHLSPRTVALHNGFGTLCHLNATIVIA